MSSVREVSATRSVMTVYRVRRGMRRPPSSRIESKYRDVPPGDTRIALPLATLRDLPCETSAKQTPRFDLAKAT
jgi:hypothetical protein